MESLRRKTSADKVQPLPAKILCACPGCRHHVARLEELNAQLSREVDRLSRDLGEEKRAA
jgi:hypothetical protein